MASSRQLIGVLKEQLKVRGITYRQLASQLALSEPTLKRWFSEFTMSLKQLDAVCEVVGLALSDLAQLAEEQERIHQLGEDQEQQLVADLRLLLVALALLNRWRFEQILMTYTFSPAELIQLLAQLDRMRFIELQPRNRVRLKVSADFTWRAAGPIQRFFERQAQQEFFQSSFDGAGELRLVLTGMLSRSSNALLQQKMERLAREFSTLRDEDAALDLEQRHGTSLVLAMRPWELAAFTQWRRPGLDKPF
ncbi:MAG: helix-turn-helix transcriptional regulator [Pseudomonas sp.]|uniref:helix-turn-helix domain-containing protein n=1 Tax=Pseudomonas sp. TaxID=306 RepID=UPI0033939E18